MQCSPLILLYYFLFCCLLSYTCTCTFDSIFLHYTERAALAPSFLKYFFSNKNSFSPPQKDIEMTDKNKGAPNGGSDPPKKKPSEVAIYNKCKIYQQLRKATLSFRCVPILCILKPLL